MGSTSLDFSKKTCLKNGGKKQAPRCCQVEGCSVDLSGAKAYYGRHRVCGTHSKTAMVIVGGMQQRFCQQCSRFHKLAEFDQGKRSCRRRLAGHNERRRKPPVSASLSSLFPDNGRLDSFLMNFKYPNELSQTFHQISGKQWQGRANFSNTQSAASLLSFNIDNVNAVSSNNSFVSYGFDQPINEAKLDAVEKQQNTVI